MAQTTTINTRTGQRLKGAKAKPKDLQPLLDFKRKLLNLLMIKLMKINFGNLIIIMTQKNREDLI